MSNHTKEPSGLEKLLQKDYGCTEAESIEAARNLVGFFELLLEIDQRNKRC